VLTSEMRRSGCVVDDELVVRASSVRRATEEGLPNVLLSTHRPAARNGAARNRGPACNRGAECVI